MTRSEKDKMLAGDLYDPSAAELQSDLAATAAWLARFNTATTMSKLDRRDILAERLAAIGANVEIRAPIYCDYGFNISVGNGAFLNFNCVILDVVAVTIGDKTQIGPGVQILTADHPREAAVRRAGLEFGRPVHIGSNVWIGGGAIILPGVIIGDNAIVGAGSVVTRNVPAGATVYGNPARIK
ncbi:sugar O-acetyltransferase [Roseiarcaceae bacterium H3SJ34-1]|uniref:sugar O-acetyltransferase n=1 Tax=Terripilifer ovatus TaxID=3032367 RepID=UPI003AB98920|nr:sugar O-acetyltransferase [Roseiarcaceae bacterium H3SJ34-1]